MQVLKFGDPFKSDNVNGMCPPFPIEAFLAFNTAVTEQYMLTILGGLKSPKKEVFSWDLQL